jgi:type I restriction-modification system DNA methylase subunit
MINLQEIDSWKKHIGLLPINLFLDTEMDQSYILHNGGKGDFCLSLEEHDPIELFSRAWSSNTDNYLTIAKGHVNVYNWKKKVIIPESIPITTVQNNYEKFYDYLADKNFRSGDDISPFVLNIFRQIRNMLGEEDGGLTSLNLLFNLLAISEEGVSIKKLDVEKWGLTHDFSHLESKILPYVEEFNSGLLYGIKPRVELIIRHSAGMLFQEAHQDVAFFNKQMTLFGSGYQSDIKYKEKFFSSTHYTPTYIARTIVENVLSQINLKDKPKLKILDPACGTSIFLLEVLKQLNALNYTGSVEVIGWDISEIAINTSRFILAYEKREWKERLDINLTVVEDSLLSTWNNDYDIILMNPPFISWEQMDKSQREGIHIALENNLDNKPNLAGAFLYKATKHISNTGVLGCVLPTSIFTYDSYSSLRKIIESYFNISFVGKLGNYIFENALTDVSIMTGTKQDIKETLVLWTENKRGVVSDSIHELRKFKYKKSPYVAKNDFSIYYPKKYPLNKDNWKPFSIDDDAFVKDLNEYLINGHLKRIGDIFNVKQGIRTGNNYIFKIDNQYYNSLSADEKKFFKPAIDNESINVGRIVSKNSYVWYPYSQEGLIINDENELERLANRFYNERLLPNKAALAKRARKSLDDWWTLSEHRSWLRKAEPRLISTEFGSSDSFAFDDKGEFVIERGNAWLPKKKNVELEFYFFYLAIFSSPLFNKLLLIYSKQLLKGVDLGSKHTENIPIPDYYSSSNTKFISMIGKKIHENEFYDTKIIDGYISPYYPNIKNHI